MLVSISNYGITVTDALISFGANLAGHNTDIASTLANVRVVLSEFKEIGPIAVSRGYRTPAFPPGSGPDFLNAAMVFPTSLDPAALLDVLHDIEHRLGRTRTRRWEPRVCDLDLLGLGDAIRPDREAVKQWMALSDEEAIARPPEVLVLPHPRMHRRAFVLVPLADIAPDWRHPVLGQSVGEMVRALAPAERAEITHWSSRRP